MLKMTIFSVVMTLVATAPAYSDDWRNCTQQADRVLAIQGCTKIIEGGEETDENLAIAHINRGGTYYNDGDFSRAIADFDKAIQIEPGIPEPYNGRGSAYFGQGNYDLAIVDYNKAIQLRPAYPAPYGSRGLVYFARGEYERAVTDFRTAANLLAPRDPGHDLALKRLAFAERALRSRGETTSPDSPPSEGGEVQTTAAENSTGLAGLRGAFRE